MEWLCAYKDKEEGKAQESIRRIVIKFRDADFCNILVVACRIKLI